MPASSTLGNQVTGRFVPQYQAFSWARFRRGGRPAQLGLQSVPARGDPSGLFRTDLLPRGARCHAIRPTLLSGRYDPARELPRRNQPTTDNGPPSTTEHARASAGGVSAQVASVFSAARFPDAWWSVWRLSAFGPPPSAFLLSASAAFL